MRLPTRRKSGVPKRASTSRRLVAERRLRQVQVAAGFRQPAQGRHGAHELQVTDLEIHRRTTLRPDARE
jgi:hypothetical protein